ncbi:hypothetical protein SPBR_06026 [Sporothrix brasiliensis 5110]|uniref:Uncharacterized protein n=1 Tax=Sporothrix brasiliensis 5110 TaxID=1398154 RepID=A0A0C2JB46_9PEZI|nr:uncharacterized protein SPBR_06026 [Sporothrix brasiliensis 5110]KIH94107.1 hypothetical protein SPBR_06026 [Sporothrix brasiliensis 5110]
MEDKGTESSRRSSPGRREKHRHREREHRQHQRHHREHRRTRSRSPRERKQQTIKDRIEDRDGHRSRRHRHRDRDRGRDKDKDGKPVQLPHGARLLVAGADYSKFSPVFAAYLSQEKHLTLAELDEHQSQSRWRRFVDKWNWRDLADKWYEPQLFLRAVRGDVAADARVEDHEEDKDKDSESSDSDYGPALPPDERDPSCKSVGSVARSRHLGVPGPAIPSRADLDERRALEEEDCQAERAALRLARRADRAEQRERLDELVPRAAAGTRERQLEKKRERNEQMRGFRDRSPGGDLVGDDELMGGDEGGSSRRSAQEKKKETDEAAARRTLWQLRREEEQRARDDELAERRAQYRAREEETMDMLRELARQRFG